MVPETAGKSSGAKIRRTGIILFTFYIYLKGWHNSTTADWFGGINFLSTERKRLQLQIFFKKFFFYEICYGSNKIQNLFQSGFSQNWKVAFIWFRLI